MSVVNCSKDSEAESPNENSSNNNNVAKKFEKYRSRVEQIQAEYIEANLVIDRLKEEINLCRDMEKRNSFEILSLRGQIQVLEDKKKSFLVLTDKQRSVQRALQKHYESINEINKEIRKMRETFKDKIATASNEIDLIGENRYLQSTLQSKEEALKSMNSTLKEKEQLILENISRNYQLNEELENLKSERDEVKDFCKRTVESYQKQIDEYEGIIQKMEQERRRILADYEVRTDIPQANYESTSENCGQDPKISESLGRATIKFFDERENNSSVENICQKSCEKFLPQTQITRLNLVEDVDFQQEKNLFQELLKKTPKSVSMQKRKFEFMDPCQPQMKRRLYSDNNNDYLS